MISGIKQLGYLKPGYRKILLKKKKRNPLVNTGENH
jgi:hypothetical protein